MFKLAALGSIAAFTLAQEHPINQEIVEEIKSKTDLWTPAEASENPLAFVPVESLLGRLGTAIDFSGDFPEPPVANSIPSAFDSRIQWPDCVHEIRDQQKCGSCWAFAASEALSDRFCIASNGKTNVVLSPEDMVDCNMSNHGCNGGVLQFAWTYLTNVGVASESCLHYTSGSGSSKACPTKCDNGSAIHKYKCEAGSVTKATNPDAIKSLIKSSGPVETGFTVYDDFMNYKSGVYHHTTGKQLGGHAVKIIGWGQENGVNFWICANSWNTSWGEQGFFRIKENECGIDSAVFGCKPDLSTAAVEEEILTPLF